MYSALSLALAIALMSDRAHCCVQEVSLQEKTEVVGDSRLRYGAYSLFHSDTGVSWCMMQEYDVRSNAC